MTKEDPLFRIVADVFSLPISEISDASSQDTIEQWDSLGMINLVGELEMSFDVQFDLTEIAILKNIAIIRTILSEKGVNFD
jgi:acyl carrier protein